jgi:hypothetical protein
MAMTTKADYTPEEWTLLMQAPMLTAMNVIAASPSGPIGVVQEMMAVTKAALDAVEKASGNELITAVATEFKATKGETAKPEGLKAEELKARSLETSRQVAALLAQKSTPEEAAAFKQWLMETAQHVAAAAKEGGFMGMGGTAVTEAETAALKEVAEALGVVA